MSSHRWAAAELLLTLWALASMCPGTRRSFAVIPALQFHNFFLFFFFHRGHSQRKRAHGEAKSSLSAVELRALLDRSVIAAAGCWPSGFPSLSLASFSCNTECLPRRRLPVNLDFSSFILANDRYQGARGECLLDQGLSGLEKKQNTHTFNFTLTQKTPLVWSLWDTQRQSVFRQTCLFLS